MSFEKLIENTSPRVLLLELLEITVRLMLLVYILLFWVLKKCINTLLSSFTVSQECFILQYLFNNYVLCNFIRVL